MLALIRQQHTVTFIYIKNRQADLWSPRRNEQHLFRLAILAPTIDVGLSYKKIKYIIWQNANMLLETVWNV